MVSIDLRIENGEALREGLKSFNKNLSSSSLGHLIEVSTKLELLMFRYQYPDMKLVLRGEIDSNSPDYQCVKNYLEQTLENIYREISLREVSH